MVLRLALLAATMAASAVNGSTFSPLFDPVLYLLRPALSPLTLGSEVMFYLTGTFIALATFLVAGIPAAAYERLRGLTQSSPGSLLIWLVAAVMASLPSILGALGYNELD